MERPFVTFEVLLCADKLINGFLRSKIIVTTENIGVAPSVVPGGKKTYAIKNWKKAH